MERKRIDQEYREKQYIKRERKAKWGLWLCCLFYDACKLTIKKSEFFAHQCCEIKTGKVGTVPTWIRII